MSTLAALTWRKLARGSVATVTNGIAEVLHAIYLSMQPSVTTYYDASARGAGTAVVASEYTVAGPLTEAVYWSYATGALTHKSIVAGRTSAATPTMGTTPAETYAINQLMAGITVSAGAFNAWDNANPFTSGRNLGYYRNSGTIATAQIWQWDIYESQEALCWVLQQSTSSGLFAFLTGAFMDPHTTAAADAETDGRIYGHCSGGTASGFSTVNMSTTNWSGGASRFFDNNGGNANTDPHGVVLLPGLSTSAAISRTGIYSYSAPTTQWAARSGQIMAHFEVPMIFTSSFFAGTLRQMGPGKVGVAGQFLQAGGVDIAYLALTNSWTTNNEACYLKY